jgi:hypothetical protein
MPKETMMNRRKPLPLEGTEIKRVRYAVEGLLPLGRLSFVIGRPGITKTMAVIDLAAQITRGAVRGDLEGRPSHVLYCTLENSRSESLMPRATAAGADTKRFQHWGGDLSIPAEIDVLRTWIGQTRAKLVVLDTLGDYVSLSIQNSQQNAKRALQPLASLAEQTGVAIVCIFWANKSGKGTNAVAGSVGNSGTARNVLVVGQLASRENVIGTIKVNDGPDHFGFVYRWELVDVADGIQAPRITWERLAKPAEIDQAQEQMTLADDPAAPVLLEYMAEACEDWSDDPPPSPDAGWFPTDELIAVIEQATLCGAAAARKVVNRAYSAGLIERWRGGQGTDFKVSWRITELGRMWMADDEENSISGWFHTDRRPSKRATRATTPTEPLALPMAAS